MKDAVSERLKAYIKERGISTEDLARSLGVGKATVHRWWKDTSPNMKQLVSIFKLFPELTPNYLFLGSDNPNPNEYKKRDESVSLLGQKNFDFEYVESLRKEHLEEVKFLRNQVEFLRTLVDPEVRLRQDLRQNPENQAG